ncbi:Uncharacterized protein DAT39_006849 [Clarias magur]|uniref:Uncharacterized protein n=1 Tax=Clarias magur TaxID=1594786 RepID=A0A8J4UPH4_CLAMG|nr:Uncharacterized protein DAT39_006849 [Clarias magur]
MRETESLWTAIFAVSLGVHSTHTVLSKLAPENTLKPALRHRPEANFLQAAALPVSLNGKPQESMRGGGPENECECD